MIPTDFCIRRRTTPSLSENFVFLAGKILLGAMLLVRPPNLVAAEPSPQAAEATAPKPGEIELKAQFTRAESTRGTVAERTRERSDAAQKATQLASDIAWIAFDAGKYEEAARWFARSGELKKDGLDNARGYWEDRLNIDVPETEKKLAAKKAEFQTNLVNAPDEAKKKEIRAGLDATETIGLMFRYNAVSMLESLARDSNDSASLVKYSEAELAIRRTELERLERTRAPPHATDLKKAEVAKALERIADGQADLAQFEPAAKNLREALALRRTLPESLPERRLDAPLEALGHMYLYRVGDVAKAKGFYEQALAELQATANLREKTRAADYFTLEQRAMFNPEELARHEKSLTENADLTRSTDTMSESMMLDNLGMVAQESGDYKTAGTFYDRALKLGEGLPQGGYLNIFLLTRAQIRARVLAELASLHNETGERGTALKELDEAIKIRREIGQDIGNANLLMQAAGLLYDKEDFEKAARYVEQARQIFAGAHRLSGVRSATTSLALIARDSGRLEDAARYAGEARQLTDQNGNFAAQSNTARTLASIRLKQANLAEAKALIEQAAAADARTNSVVDKIATLGIAGELLEAEGTNPQALEKYQEAVKLIETARATAASESAFAAVKRNAKPYERIVGLLLKMGRSEEAFDYLNRAKSQTLKEAIPLTGIKSRDKPTQKLIDEAAGLERQQRAATAQVQAENAKPASERDKAKVEAGEARIASTQGEVRRVFEKIKTGNPDWGNIMKSPDSLEAVQDFIPAGVTLLQYAPFGDQLYIFVVTNETLKVVTAPAKREELEKKVKITRRQITSGESGPALNKSLSALYDILIQPIEPELAATKVIAFIPNGFLYYLPIQALVKQQPRGEPRYLIEDKQIVYLAGGNVLRAAKPPSAGRSRVGMMAIGNPTGAELPSADVEVRTIATVFPATEVLSGPQANKAAVTEGRVDKRVLHFATHGRLNAATPDKSFIQLASGSTPGEEQLTADEIWDLPLKHVDLVTLSACETALGDEEPEGAEITTLAEAFSTAGAASVVASLWSVGDESTKEFMIEFYQRLAGGASKAAALQAAQLKLLKSPKYSRPLYWAPFVLMGDWRAQEQTREK